MLTEQTHQHPLDSLQRVAEAEDVLKAQKEVLEVHVADSVKDYIIRLVEATRKHDDIYLGASPRGSLVLYKLGQALAASHGRSYVIPDDVKELVPLTLSHRTLVRPEAKWEERDETAILEEIVAGTRPPVTADYAET